MALQHADPRPTVDMAEIKEHFKCGDDIAEQIMESSDLAEGLMWIGKKLRRIDRGVWEKYLDNLFLHHGCRNISEGIGMIISFGPGKEWQHLLSIGLTQEQLEAWYVREKERRKQQNQQG